REPQRLPNSASMGERKAEEGIRASRRDGKGVRVGDTSEPVRCAPHRQKHTQQQVGQSCFADKEGTSGSSLEPRSDVQRRTVRIEKIEKIGEHRVWDIAVEEDMSYYSAGIVS